MKNKLTFLIIITVALISCKKDELDLNGEIKDGFCIVANDKVVLDHNDIDYYDYSNHLIYLKNKKSFPNDIVDYGTFTVFADKEEIYSGQLFPPNFTILPSKPTIFAKHSRYGDYIIPIEYMMNITWDTLGNIMQDPRQDDRIIETLKKHNQFRAGLSCEIQSVQYLASNDVKIELILKNSDSFNYYYLDPNKMGTTLFHYFTNGLVIRTFGNNYKKYNHKVEAISVEPWNSWNKDWLSIINGNESKTITIVYDSFEDVPKGQYKATFEFPGLSFQVDKKDIVQDNGPIWLGELNMIKEITIE
ncbi:MAG: hypothetical protein KDE33_14910 [Bacteroidetes bacterium]|nr:hypothetical protein [Bacteroidota bacterium]